MPRFEQEGFDPRRRRENDALDRTVRVRTYKTVKIGGKSVKLYSGWSKAKSVTTKK